MKSCYVRLYVIQWVNPTNVTLSVFSDDRPFWVAEVESAEQSLPEHVDTLGILWKRSPLLCFFAAESKLAPCIAHSDPLFWRYIDNHNRTCECYIGIRKNEHHHRRVSDDPHNVAMCDIWIRGYDVVNDQ